MPHSTLKLHAGVDENRTLALNEAAVSTSNLIRFFYDKEGLGLVQKLGGWVRYFPTALTDIVRALWAWEDTNANKYLAVGRQATSISGDALSIINNGSIFIITPQTRTDNVSLNVTTTLGSASVVIYDAGSNVVNSDSVYIQTQISVGGLILFGLYPCTYLGPDQYQITAIDALGNPLPATNSVSSGGSVPVFTFAASSASVNVNLNNHGFVVGDIFPIVVSVTSSAANVTLYGNYTVQSVTDANNFSINASATASSGGTVTMNGNLARYEYFITYAPAPTSVGYGVGGYGVGGYGIGTPGPTPIAAAPINSSDWTLDNWGSILVSCPVIVNSDGSFSGGPIYQWDPVSNKTTNASVIPQAPVANDGIFVAMPQRQIVAWGSTFSGIQDPLLLTWCDVNNFNSWITTATNQAGSYRIPKGSRIVGCIQGPQQGLIWTDIGLWAMQYSGPPYVYQFNEIGTGCGLISRKAAGSMNGIVYWMGQSQFFMLGSSGVQVINCPIWDVIFQNLDRNNLWKIRFAANSNYSEISWYYPTTDSNGEISSYVKYNVALGTWDYGQLSRTAWINQSVLGSPIGAYPFSSGSGYSSYIYQHDGVDPATGLLATDADGAPINASFQTGYFVISDGEWKVFVDQIWPDMKWGYFGQSQNANVQITFYVTDYPGQQPRVYGPYNMTQGTQFLTPRFRGRLLSIGISSNDVGTFWRLGAMRYRFEQDGKF